MIKVCVFEDNKHLRETLSLLLNAAPAFDCVGAFPNCDNLIQVLKSHFCDVVLMDIEMPGMNGIEATKIIKEHFTHTQILIQTAFQDDDYIFNAICAGASGYILKNTSPEGYLEAVKEVHQGGSPMTSGIARRVLALFKDNLQVQKIKDYQLTTQEKNVLQLLVNGKSYKMIANELQVSHNTVKSHITNIYAKLHVNSGTEAVALALREKII